MSGNNVSRFLPGVVNFVWRDIKIFFDSIFCIIHVLHFLIQFRFLKRKKRTSTFFFFFVVLFFSSRCPFLLIVRAFFKCTFSRTTCKNILGRKHNIIGTQQEKCSSPTPGFETASTLSLLSSVCFPFCWTSTATVWDQTGLYKKCSVLMNIADHSYYYSCLQLPWASLFSPLCS